jgi:hypothetical protein
VEAKNQAKKKRKVADSGAGKAKMRELYDKGKGRKERGAVKRKC